MTEQERRERLDCYRALCRELDRELVKALSYEDKEKPESWRAKDLFLDVIGRFTWLLDR
jgi:hypothetical protein